MSFRAARQLFAAAQSKATGAKKPSPFVRNWLSDTATYPIMIVIAAAGGLVLYQGQRLIFGHPDVNWDKDDRASYIRDNDDDSESHYEHFLRKRARTSSAEIVPGINNMMVKNKVRE